MRAVFFLMIFPVVFSGYSQKEKRNPIFSVRGLIGIPKTVSSARFHTSFNGVYEANLTVNARTFSNFFIGAGYQNSHFQNNKEVFAVKRFYDKNGNATGAVVSYNTRLDCQSGFLCLGYDKPFEKGFVSYIVNFGVTFARYQNVNRDTSVANRPYPPTTFNAPYIQPQIAVNFLTDGKLSFSLLLSYTTMLYRFDARAPRFMHFEEVSSKKNKYMMSWINIGLGFNIMPGKK
jgi:hypothetical protein